MIVHAYDLFSGGGGGSGPAAGYGSTSDSLTSYPKTADTTVADKYVDPTNGSDGNSGNSDTDAYATLTYALTQISSGRIAVMAGTLTPTARYTINNTGLLEIFNYGTDRPVFDGSSFPSGTDNKTTQRIFNLTSDVHLKGLSITNVDSEDGAIYIDGDHCTIEAVWGYGLGGKVAGSGTTLTMIWGTSAYSNVVMDCAHWESGDGATSGTNTGDCYQCTGGAYSCSFVRDIGFNGGDDCYDFYQSHDCLVLDCVAVGAGYYYNGTAGSTTGDGVGFKMGGGTSGTGNNICAYSLAVGCSNEPASHNQAPLAGIEIYNLTAYSCGAHIDGGSGLSTNHNVLRNLVYEDINLKNISNGDGYYAGTYCDHTYSVENDPADAGGNGDFPIVTITAGVTSGSVGFEDVSTYKFGLAANSPCLNAGSDGDHMGASQIAIDLAYQWMNDAGVTWYGYGGI